MNPPSTQRIGLERLGAARPGSAGAPSGLIDLSCSGPRFEQHHYRIPPPPSTGDVSGKVYSTPEREASCGQNVVGSRAGGLQRDGVSDLRSMIPSSPTDITPQVSITVNNVVRASDL